MSDVYPLIIAGHTFDRTGTCTAILRAGTPEEHVCGRRWLDIRNTPREEVGRDGIAHSGVLTESEWQSIAARRAIEDERIEAAMAGVSA